MHVKDIREFRTVINNAKAQMGVFITLESFLFIES